MNLSALRGERPGHCAGVILACLALVTASCSKPGSGTVPASVRLSPQTGSTVVQRGEQERVLRSDDEISAGDRVRVAGDGTARLQTGSGTTLDLRGASLLVGSASTFRLLSGSVLVRSRAPLEIDSDEVKVSAGSGVFRIDKELATRVANYAGNRLSVSAGPDRLTVPRLRQVVTVQGTIPRAARPLRYSTGDIWDRRLLADAIDLDQRLGNFATGLEAQLTDSEPATFFQRVSAGLSSVDFLGPYLGSRRSDVLIGLMMAAEAGTLRHLSLPERFNRIFELWRDGATWGLISQEFGVEAEGLFGRLAEAVTSARIQVIGPGPGLLQPGRGPSPARPRAPGAPARRSPGSAPVAPPTPGTSPPAAALLPPAVSGVAPPAAKQILNDLVGVVDPVVGLPPVT